MCVYARFACLVLCLVAPAELHAQAAQSTPPPITTVRRCNGPATSLPLRLVQLLPQRDSLNWDHRTAELARRIPGGYANRAGDSGRLVIMLVRPDRKAEAMAALARELPWGKEWDTAVVRRARWDYHQLVDWKEYVSVVGESALTANWGLYIDILANRIRFNVKNSRERARLIKALRAVPVPCDLVEIQLGAPEFYRARSNEEL